MFNNSKLETPTPMKKKTSKLNLWIQIIN